jgi:hypothetical protein
MTAIHAKKERKIMLMKRFLQLAFLIMLAMGMIQLEGLVSAVFAQEIQIDFESFPKDPQPVDEMKVYDQYLASHFITYIIDRDGNPNTTGDRTKPLIEDRGGALENPPEAGDLSGFRYDIGFRQKDPEYIDIEHPDFRTPQLGLGKFFLKLNTDEPKNVNLLIELHKPAIEVSGRIWDIDARGSKDAIEREQWRIRAYTKNSKGQYVEAGSLLSPAGYHPFWEPESAGILILMGNLFHGNSKVRSFLEIP